MEWHTALQDMCHHCLSFGLMGAGDAACPQL
jgi:hypothetical protein